MNVKKCIAEVEPSMQVYLEEHCADGPSTMGRQVILWKTLGSFLFLMPTLSFGVMLLPFAPVEAGFHQNWVFNYLAHPILNYITARAYLELGLRRPLEPSEKHRVNWIVRCFPLVDTVVPWRKTVASCHICSGSQRLSTKLFLGDFLYFSLSKYRLWTSRVWTCDPIRPESK